MEKKCKSSTTSKDVSLSEVLEQLPGHIYWKNREGIFLGSNTNNWKEFGLESLSDFEGKTDYDLSTKEEAEKCRSNDEEVMRTGKTKIVEEVFQGALYLSHKTPLRNSEQEIVGTVGVSLDITNAKQEEIDRLEMLENIIAVMPNYIYWMNKDGVYLGCNDNEAKIIGLASRKDFIGKRNVDMPGFLIPEVLDLNNKAVLEDGETISLEEPAILPDGTKATFLSNKVPLRNGRGEIIGMVGISVDISAVKEKQALEAQIEATERSQRSKLEFVSTVSHEIRNPVGNVVSFQSRMEEEVENLKDVFYGELVDRLDHDKDGKLIQKISTMFKDIEKSSALIESEAQRSLRALKNLGELQHLQVNGVRLDFDQTSVVSLIEDAIKRSPYPNEGKVEFQIDIKPSVPSDVIVDQNNILSGLSIVIGNAIRFSPDKERVKICVDAKQDYLYIKVQDFGIGMVPAQLQNLFGDFFDDDKMRLSAPRYHKPSVQLSLARLQIEASGGKLDIKSAEKKGTVVEVKVPYQSPASVVSGTKASKENAECETSVLVVEDDTVSQYVMKMFLEQLNVRFDIAGNAADAIKMALKKHYDVAFLDISLPDRSGLDVMEAVKKKKGDSIIFVAVTSHASDEDESYFIQRGVMTVLAKPVSVEQLKEAIEAAMQVKKDMFLER
jgi:two-component system aerobic respiration control sensor histidine kinase ArcB